MDSSLNNNSNISDMVEELRRLKERIKELQLELTYCKQQQRQLQITINNTGVGGGGGGGGGGGSVGLSKKFNQPKYS